MGWPQGWEGGAGLGLVLLLALGQVWWHLCGVCGHNWLLLAPHLGLSVLTQSRRHPMLGLVRGVCLLLLRVPVRSARCGRAFCTAGDTNRAPALPGKGLLP